MPGSWPPPYEGMSASVMAPAGELPSAGWRLPDKDELDWAQKGMTCVLLGLALIGLLIMLSSNGPGAIARGVARQHAKGI